LKKCQKELPEKMLLSAGKKVINEYE